MTAAPAPCPPEFERFAKFYYAACAIMDYSPIAGHVLRHVFHDHVGEILPKVTSQQAKQFAESYERHLAPFPNDGVDELRYFAGELYEVLKGNLRAGKISPDIADQYYLCSTIYSVLEGDDCIARERKCRHVACRLNRLLKRATKRRPAGKSHGQIDKKVIQEMMRSVQPMARVASQLVLPDFRKSFQENEITQFLMSCGVNIEKKSIPRDQDARAFIQQSLDNALDMMKNRKERQALECLRSALAAWESL
jgi:hypothetical protein